VLARTLAAVRPTRPLVALIGVLADKDWRGILAALAPHVDRFVLTQPPTAPADRAWDVEAAREHAESAGYAVVAEPDFGRALRLAREGAATTLVAGSFHTVGDAMARLQLRPYGP
jgi:dihydrofolate synthase/folylpolyglutamate synthase